MMHIHAVVVALLLLCVAHHASITTVSAVRLRAYNYRHPHVRYDHYHNYYHNHRDSSSRSDEEEDEEEDENEDDSPRRLSSSLKGLTFDLSGFGFDVNERDDEGSSNKRINRMTLTENMLISSSISPPVMTIEPSTSPEASIEPYPSPSPDYDLSSSSSSSSSSGKQPRAATTSSNKENPCKDGYTLYKQYTNYPAYIYVCQKAQRFDAEKTTARCPDGFFRRMELCIRSTRLCAFTPMADPSCTVDACSSVVGPDSEAEYRLVEYVASCLICPRNYLLYFDEEADVYRCYKRLVETPVCVNGKVFDSDVGKCL